MTETQPTISEFRCLKFPDNGFFTVRSRFNTKNIDAKKLATEVEQ